MNRPPASRGSPPERASKHAIGKAEQSDCAFSEAEDALSPIFQNGYEAGGSSSEGGEEEEADLGDVAEPRTKLEEEREEADHTTDSNNGTRVARLWATFVYIKNLIPSAHKMWG